MTRLRPYAGRIAAWLYGFALLLALLPAGSTAGDEPNTTNICGPAIVKVFGTGEEDCDGKGRGRMDVVLLALMLAAPATVVYLDPRDR